MSSFLVTGMSLNYLQLHLLLLVSLMMTMTVIIIIIIIIIIIFSKMKYNQRPNLQKMKIMAGQFLLRSFPAHSGRDFKQRNNYRESTLFLN